MLLARALGLGVVVWLGCLGSATAEHSKRLTKAELKRQAAMRKQLITAQKQLEAEHNGLAEEALKRLAQKLGSELFRLTKDASGFTQLEQSFRAAGVRVEKQDVAARLQEIATKLSSTMSKKVEAVKRLVETAEQITRAAAWDPHVNVSYYNAKELNNVKNDSSWPFLTMDFTADPRYHYEEVNMLRSTVHVPTNIFNRSPTVLYGVRWSKQLDKTFRVNQANDDSLRWQYFGSAEGFMRLYPGARWSMEPDRPDMYDCRLTNWYIRAASSPKDMLILLDMSGSMTGIRQEIARTTVKEIMNTLHEDDFFNIIKVAEVARYLEPCLKDTLVQASELTKSLFEERIKLLKTENIANFTEALQMAFAVLNRTDPARESAGCNKAIMIISDGLPEEYDDLMAELNPEKRVRVFTYVIGREVTDVSNMKKMACLNRGYVTHVSTMADVRDNVEDYYRVLGRPMVLSQNHTNIWTNVYWHAKPNAGMVISVAQPVFNRSLAAEKKGSLIGVMGIDVNVSDIRAIMTPYRWGAGSYIFGTNHNGHVLFHPFWKAMVKPSAVPKHSYNEVDLSEVEWQIPKDNHHAASPERAFSLPLRNDMVNQLTGQKTMLILRQLHHRKRVYVREYNYYYTGILDTPLSVGIAIPARMGRPNTELLRVTGRMPFADFQRLNIDYSDTEWRLHPEWAFCNATITNITHLVEVLQRNAVAGVGGEAAGADAAAVPISCNAELVESLLLDIRATEAAVAHWREVAEKPIGSGQFGVPIEIETLFTATRSGLTRYKELPPLPQDVVEKPADDLGTVEYLRVLRNEQGPTGITPLQNNATEAAATAPGKDNKPNKHFFDFHSMAVDESFYERSVSSASEMVITTPLAAPGAPTISHPDEDESSVMASVPVYVSSPPTSNQLAPAAIVGIIIKRRTVRSLLLHLSKETCLFGGAGKKAEQCLSCHHAGVVCYLVDESGYVVTSTREEDDRGRFFGMLHGEVMAQLIHHNITKRYKVYDFQGMCIKNTSKDASDSASILRSLFGSVFHASRLLLGQIFTFLYTVLRGVIPVAGDMQVEEVPQFRYLYSDDPGCKTKQQEEEDALEEAATQATLEDEGSGDGNETAADDDHEEPAEERKCQRPPPVAPPMYPCDMEYHLYHTEWTQVKARFSFGCLANCTKNVGVFKVSTTNMILVALDRPLSCPCNDTQLHTPSPASSTTSRSPAPARKRRRRPRRTPRPPARRPRPCRWRSSCSLVGAAASTTSAPTAANPTTAIPSITMRIRVTAAWAGWI
ncbi:voltage-dependent calcium channel subunit alpha-2/delta-4-like isoform X2 [Paramacrobiotus metropolitanus]|uniref:voltage-dependent calcium channel subunit alpha-2/delta-4-like isoform X2 n=1 Tax=Paramacrobiotus metropolitanus TaxID=2943436 RepID=UPI002445684A|nr:voltage-dependent calcium channel subunit alpha-2/delta-4-like isoform X2 [Paramacrobiotus metropolitanus]